MAIVRLALANPPANTDTLLHTAVRNSVVSVIATNKSASATATVQIWIAPQGVVSASGYAYQAYDAIIPVSNSMETFRFSLQNGDRIYVRSSTANISFSLNGIHDSSGNYNKVTIQTTAPNAPAIGDVWVNSATAVVAFWNGSQWISAVGGSAGYPQNTEPSFPSTGTLWVDTDDVSPNYPQFPTVIYSPTDPSASLTVADTGTIWVDEDFPTPLETVVPAILYQPTAPTGLIQNDVGYLWVDSDENVIEYNMNDYATLTYVNDQLATAGFNPFLLAGM